MSNQKPQALSLRHQFAAAAIGVGAGVAAAYGVNETMTMLAGASYGTSAISFLFNFGALFAVSGATTAYAESKMRPAPRP